MKKVVVFGGGHGQAAILEGIKDLQDIHLSTIVTVADDGGSTGRLRMRYEIPAMGDIRNLLIALRGNDSLWSQLMSYRFEGGEEVDVEGHSLGNLLLTAMTKIHGSFDKGIEIISKELEVKGDVLPSSFEVVSLYALMDDDTVVKGEANIPSFNHRIQSVFYDHEVAANPKAIRAIREADLIIYGIGSIYTSILPVVILSEIQKALQESSALKVYFANCMTQNNETFNYDLADHVAALEKHGAKIDMVVKHNNIIPQEILERYHKENSIEVLYSRPIRQKVMACDLLDFSKQVVRHSPSKIKKVIAELIKEIS